MDIATLLVTSLALFSATTLLMFQALRTRLTYRGFGWWVAAFALITLGAAMFLPLVPERWTTLVLRNALLLGGLVLILRGLLLFRGERVGWWLEGGLAACVLAVFGYLAADPAQLPARIVASSLLAVALSGGIVFVAVRGRVGRLGAADVLLVICMSALALVNAARALHQLAAPTAVSDFESLEQLHGVFVLLQMLATQLAALALLGLNSERAERDHGVNEARLRDSEERFRRLFEETRRATALAEGSRFVSANRAALALFGAERADQLVGRSVIELSPSLQPDGQSSADKTAAVIRSVLREGSFEFEWEHLRVGGDRFMANVLVTAIREGGRDLLHVVWHDITERKRNEAELARHREHLEALVRERTAELAAASQRLGDTVFALDRLGTSILWAEADSGRILWGNRHAAESRGYTLGEFLALHMSGIDRALGGDNYARIAAGIRERGSGRIEAINWRKDGSSFPVEWQVHYDAGRAGRPARFIAFGNDISERKAAERALRGAREAAEAANRAKSVFLANMSHEIRTPLNGMIGLAHLIREDGLEPVQAGRMSKLEAAAGHLLEILNAILDLSKIEAGKFVLEERPLDVRRIVANAVSMLDERARAKGLRLATEVGPMPEGLAGDATRLLQALLNYGTNAIRFTDAGSVTIRARLEQEDASAAAIRFEVEDTGVGLASDAIPKLFAAFAQGEHDGERAPGGTGLGLVITRKLAEAMGGEAGARSTQGVGSTFWFTARLHKRALVAAPDAGSGAADAAAILRRDHAGTRVLVAEDNEVNAEIAKAMLERAGLVADVARDGVEAVEMATRNDYRLVLMDVQMPRMDGLDAARAIRAQRSSARLPIVAMTANAFSEDRERCAAAGMDGFLGKPAQPQVFYGTVLEWLESTREAAGAG